MRQDVIRNEELFDLERTEASDLFETFEYPWEVLGEIHDFILSYGTLLPEEAYEKRGDDIWIARTARIYPNVCIEGPCIIGENVTLRNGAFIRGDAMIGAGSVIGNSCEIKNAIVFERCEVPHFNYVGDSILGYHAHMGAGSILSNVRSDRRNIVIHACGQEYETGRRKIGAFLGDYAEIGCNAVLNPGSIIGPRSIVYPTTCFRGVLPPDTICTNSLERREKETADR